MAQQTDCGRQFFFFEYEISKPRVLVTMKDVPSPPMSSTSESRSSPSESPAPPSLIQSDEIMFSRLCMHFRIAMFRSGTFT